MDKRLPIIYVRGYAMTETERNETTADPFCGFNVGSTMYRATAKSDQVVDKFVFESPLVRLVTDYGYRQVYQNGADIMDPDWSPARDDQGNEISGIPPQSVIVYRYYDSGSAAFGNGRPRDITEYGSGLSALIARVRELVCAWKPADGKPLDPKDFRCYLVAHSMGGLVCRSFLQSRALDPKNVRGCVDKFFTFATPHNGIDVLGINVPSWLSKDEANTFSRPAMAQYLQMQGIADANGGRVDFMPASALDPRRVFCMVGTNRGDYEVAMGLVRAFVGHGSDGLVRVANASLWGCDDAGRLTQPCATAYAYRSHSGNYGIVNSEEAYQNLVRFLFGDLRIDIWIDIDSVQLPDAIAKEAQVAALYQVELLAAPRGKRWYLTRRTSEEDSPACFTHDALTGADPGAKSAHLSTVFLSNKYRIPGGDPSLVYAMTLGVRVPDYEVDRKFWPNEHLEGAYLFRDTAIITVPSQPGADGSWTVTVEWIGHPGPMKKALAPLKKSGQPGIEIEFGDPAAHPGIHGKVRLEVSPWNT